MQSQAFLLPHFSQRDFLTTMHTHCSRSFYFAWRRIFCSEHILWSIIEKTMMSLTIAQLYFASCILFFLQVLPPPSSIFTISKRSNRSPEKVYLFFLHEVLYNYCCSGTFFRIFKTFCSPPKYFLSIVDFSFSFMYLLISSFAYVSPGIQLQKLFAMAWIYWSNDSAKRWMQNSEIKKRSNHISRRFKTIY